MKVDKICPTTDVWGRMPRPLGEPIELVDPIPIEGKVEVTMFISKDEVALYRVDGEDLILVGKSKIKEKKR